MSESLCVCVYIYMCVCMGSALFTWIPSRCASFSKLSCHSWSHSVIRRAYKGVAPVTRLLVRAGTVCLENPGKTAVAKCFNPSWTLLLAVVFFFYSLDLKPSSVLRGLTLIELFFWVYWTIFNVCSTPWQLRYATVALKKKEPDQTNKKTPSAWKGIWLTQCCSHAKQTSHDVSTAC